MSKYPFSFEIFLNAYKTLNISNDLNEQSKRDIFTIYENNLMNYNEFINKVALYLNINDFEKNQYLKQEKKCILCKVNYSYDKESFLYYLNNDTEDDITYKICYDCMKYSNNCSKCNFFFKF